MGSRGGRAQGGATQGGDWPATVLPGPVRNADSRPRPVPPHQGDWGLVTCTAATPEHSDHRCHLSLWGPLPTQPGWVGPARTPCSQ